MMYLLIFIWLTEPFQKSPQSSVVAEFNSKAACMAAANDVRRQALAADRRVPLLMCAEKGDKP